MIYGLRHGQGLEGPSSLPMQLPQGCSVKSLPGRGGWTPGFLWVTGQVGVQESVRGLHSSGPQPVMCRYLRDTGHSPTKDIGPTFGRRSPGQGLGWCSQATGGMGPPSELL